MIFFRKTVFLFLALFSIASVFADEIKKPKKIVLPISEHDDFTQLDFLTSDNKDLVNDSEFCPVFTARTKSKKKNRTLQSSTKAFGMSTAVCPKAGLAAWLTSKSAKKTARSWATFTQNRFLIRTFYE